MLKERYRLISRALIFLDGVILAAAFIMAYYLRLHFSDHYGFDIIEKDVVSGGPAALELYFPLLFWSVGIWCWMLVINGVYKSFRGHSFTEMIWDIIQASFFSAGFFGAITFFLKIQFVSRLFFLIYIIMGISFLIAEKWFIVKISRHVRSKGHNYRQLLLAGTGPRAGRFIELINRHPEWGFRIAGLIDYEEERVGNEFYGIKVIGSLKDIPQVLRDKVIDEVVFIVPRGWLESIQESITDCELQGVKTSVAADLFDLRVARSYQTDLDGFPLLTFQSTSSSEIQLFIKRCLDLAVSFTGLLFLAPLMIIVALLVKFSTPGPVFFRQKRVGLHGRVFVLYKFRSMFSDAQERLEEVRHLNEMDGPVFKIKKDPRITPLGKILRKTSIDELPQLINVLFGQMSLIGPRPPLPGEVTEYEHWQVRRLSMRPGITCLWQVSGRNKISFDKWMELDLEYIDNWSLALDMRIFLKTIPMVIFGIGAR